MALGSNTYQNNNQQQNFEPSYYSRFRIKNAVENLSLTFTYWKGLLKLSISQSNDNTNNNGGGKVVELASIHLSPLKARLFANCVQKVIDDTESSSSYGVNTGTGASNGLIAIGREMGKAYLIIAKVNGDGSFEAKQRFDFNINYNFSLKFSDFDKLSHVKEMDDNIELVIFRDALIDYSRAFVGAYAAATHDIGRYETGKINSLIRNIAEKNGIQTKSNNSNFGTGFFNGSSGGYDTPSSSGNKKYSVDSIDSLEDALG